MNRKLLLSGPGYSAEAKAVFAAMTTPPTKTRRALIDQTIRTIKASGAWTRLDALWVLAADDSQAALLNWKNPGTFNLTETNAPTFLADRGYTGNGTTSLLTGPNLLTFGGQYVTDDSHMGVWVGTNVVEAAGDIGTNGATRSYIRANQSGTALQTRMNDGTGTNTTITPGTAVGHSVISRSISTSYDIYKNAVNIGSPVVTSTGVISGSIQVGGSGATFSTKREQAGHFGASLTAPQNTSIYAALNNYMTAVGA